MALQNPNNLYAGYAQVVDTRPSLNFATRLYAQRQAKMDALDQYYSKLQFDTGGNEDKMRPIDIEEGWGKKLQDYQMYYMNPENKKAILNPNKYGYEKVNTWNAMHNDLIKDARASKDRLAQEKLVNVHRLSGKWNPTNPDMEEVERLSRSIYDKDRLATEPDSLSGLPITREPNVNNLSVNVPAYDALKESQFLKSAVGQAKTGKKYDESKARIDRKTGEIFLPFKESYSPETVKSIADNAGKLATVRNTPANVYYEHLKEEPEFVIQATPAYQSVYGKLNPDGSENVIDTPAKAAQAEYIVKAAQSGKEGEDKVTDWQTRQRLSQRFAQAQQKRSQDHQEKMLGLREGYQETLSKFKTDLAAGELDNKLDKLNEISYNTGNDKLNKVRLEGITIDGEKYNGRFIAVPLSMTSEDAIPELDKNGNPIPGGWKSADSYYMTKDRKKVIAVHFGKDSATGGKYITHSKIIPIHLWKERQAKNFIGKRQQASEIISDVDFTEIEDDTPPARTTTKETHTIKTTKSKNPLGLDL